MHSLTDVNWQMKHSTDVEEQNEEHLRTSLLFTKLQLYNRKRVECIMKLSGIIANKKKQ